LPFTLGIHFFPRLFLHGIVFFLLEHGAGLLGGDQGVL
jgi:hypothetical protein